VSKIAELNLRRKPSQYKDTVRTETPPNNACTGRLVGPAKKANLGEQFIPFRQSLLPAAGNASR
jgi:hypothetical protein